MRATPRAVASTLLLLAGCAMAGTTAGAGTGGAASPATLPPPGFGTLHQDEVSVNLRSGDLLVKVTPLAEAVIRVTAPDTYRRLEGLVTAQGATAAAASDGAPQLFLVSLFSDAAGVGFTPEDLDLVSGGIRFRPSAIVPITPGWGRHRLEQRETEMAVYAFSEDVDLESDDLVVVWDDRESKQWAAILPRIQAERARARARAGGQR